MPSWVASILRVLSDSVLQALMDWWKAEEAEAAKSAAKAREQQLRSVREGLARESEIAERILQTPAPASGKDWNKSALLLLLWILILPLAGCFRHYIVQEPYYPVPPLPERPVLVDLSPFNEREQQLATYAAALEQVVIEIRISAIRANSENDYPVSAEDAAWFAERTNP